MAAQSRLRRTDIVGPSLQRNATAKSGKSLRGLAGFAMALELGIAMLDLSIPRRGLAVRCSQHRDGFFVNGCRIGASQLGHVGLSRRSFHNTSDMEDGTNKNDEPLYHVVLSFWSMRDRC